MNKLFLSLPVLLFSLSAQADWKAECKATVSYFNGKGAPKTVIMMISEDAMLITDQKGQGRTNFSINFNKSFAPRMVGYSCTDASFDMAGDEITLREQNFRVSPPKGTLFAAKRLRGTMSRGTETTLYQCKSL